MENLNELCLNLREALNKKISDLLIFDEVCVFSCKDFEAFNDNSNFSTNLFDNLKNTAGLYLIEIKRDNTSKYSQWIQDFTLNFRGREGEEKYFLHKFTPNIIEKRKNLHLESNPEWIPLYLGKSKNIKDRIIKHLFSKLEFPPFGLKLYSRLNAQKQQIYYNDYFRIKVLNLNIIGNENYDFVVPYLERKLRDKINPIVGKQ